MPTSSEIVGSWFPTGYYGHFRSKSRPDFLCEYRQLAKPQPPDRFIRRSMKPCSSHVFSYHDNRHAFLGDAVVFEQGLGRRRDSTRSYDFKPDFYTWLPHKEEVERGRPLVSTYKLDFSKNGKSQLFTKRPVTSFEHQSGITTYRYAHGTAAPNREEIRAQATPTLVLGFHQRDMMGLRAASRANRDTVASCLSWYRPQVPQATATTDFSCVQHVPAPPPTAPPAMQHVPAPPTAPAPPPPQTAPES